MSRRETAAALQRVAQAAFGPDAQIGSINWGDGHRRMLLWNRRYERSLRRSLRNQPPQFRSQPWRPGIPVEVDPPDDLHRPHEEA